MIDPVKLIEKYYSPHSPAFDILIRHSRMVALKALDIAKRLSHLRPDFEFIEEAAMLHDIGIFMTNEPAIDCHGDRPYVCHGYLGRQLLEGEGLPGHGLVCERHVGVGISVGDIESHGLPLPKRDMLPVTLEEKIICFADKFFSKKPDALEREKDIIEVRRQILRYGRGKLSRFEEMASLFQ
jgi:uncharacterized protein